MSAEFGVTPPLCVLVFVADSAGVASAAEACEVIKTDAATAAAAASW